MSVDIMYMNDIGGDPFELRDDPSCRFLRIEAVIPEYS